MTLAILGAPGFGTPELILIIFVLVLLFGAKKLPEMARGSGRALRIFKAETKGLMSDDDVTDPATSAPPSGAVPPPAVSAGSAAAQPPPRVEPVAPPRPVDEPTTRDSDR